jgi:hypothetical protein
MVKFNNFPSFPTLRQLTTSAQTICQTAQNLYPPQSLNSKMTSMLDTGALMKATFWTERGFHLNST